MSQCPKCGTVFKGSNLGAHVIVCRVTEPELFWMRVTRGNGCWEWNGAKHRDGYGRFNARTGMVIAHRYAWILGNGAVPAGKDVCHTCDNPGCVNPAHLWLGTASENMLDMFAKGRDNSKGERNRWAKLTDEKVREIRRDFTRTNKRDSNAQELAARYGVTRGTIYIVVKGAQWKHVQ